MKRPLRPDEKHIWGMVASTVHPLPGRATAAPEPSDAIPPPPMTMADAGVRIVLPPKPGAKKSKARQDVDIIEPRRKHRIVRERDEIGARLDLHGLDQDRARGMLERFLAQAWDNGFRAVLVITGKGVQGDGILKRRAPEWLAAPHLAHIVAGISDAARHHGGEGALYVALKRKGRI